MIEPSLGAAGAGWAYPARYPAGNSATKPSAAPSTNPVAPLTTPTVRRRPCPNTRSMPSTVRTPVMAMFVGSHPCEARSMFCAASALATWNQPCMLCRYPYLPPVGRPSPGICPGPPIALLANVTATTPSAVIPPRMRGVQAVFGEPNEVLVPVAALYRYTSPFGKFGLLPPRSAMLPSDETAIGKFQVPP